VGGSAGLWEFTLCLVGKIYNSLHSITVRTLACHCISFSLFKLGKCNGRAPVEQRHWQRHCESSHDAINSKTADTLGSNLGNNPKATIPVINFPLTLCLSHIVTACQSGAYHIQSLFVFTLTYSLCKRYTSPAVCNCGFCVQTKQNGRAGKWNRPTCALCGILVPFHQTKLLNFWFVCHGS